MPPPRIEQIDSRLVIALREIARRLRARRLHWRSARVWLLGCGVGAALVAASWALHAPGPVVFGVALASALVAAAWVARLWLREPLDFAAAATAVERHHPDLEAALRTALEQHPSADGRYTFLQRRVIQRALDHGLRHDWERATQPRDAWPDLAHAGAALALVALLAGAMMVSHASRGWPAGTGGATEVAVTPGDAAVERGTTVLVTARFDGHTPRSATLVWTAADGQPQRAAMERSLSDPVFAFTLRAVASDVEYRIAYDEADAGPFRLSVYDLPALVRADVGLDFPQFTQLPDKRIEDTRRVSAVEGTHVAYEFLMNKPVRRAVLRSEQGDALELTPANPERTRFAADFVLQTSARYTLDLEDDEARHNAAPPDFRFEALPNRRPELRVLFPRGDQRVSSLEEIHLEGEARDDFGLVDYGLAYAVGPNEPTYLSLRHGPAPTRDAKFQNLLALEPQAAGVDQLVTWFAWADDIGSDGATRRTVGELSFAEVRPFDEVFREDAGGGAQNQAAGQEGGPGEQLLELQRQISLAIWKLRQSGATADTFADDVGTLSESQGHAQQQLLVLTEELSEPRQREAATKAGGFMEQAQEGLAAAGAQHAVAPLDRAWSGAQGAYQELLRMQPREFRVAQSRARDGQPGGRMNQRQLNQLRFNSEADRYETETEAQPMTTPEEREQLAVLARLRELARRQQDVNERLQQLQTALTEATDDAERERVERELKRLEEEQRRMLADLDDVRQRLDRAGASGEQTNRAREQLDQTREDMRRSQDALRERAVSQALASGARAQEKLDQVGEDFRRQSSSRFAEQLRELRRAARSLAQQQTEAEQALNQQEQSGPQSLDDSSQRDALAQGMEERRANLDQLMDQLREVTEDAEVPEPGLHRQLYEVVREQSQQAAAEQLDNGAELMRRGFVDQARQLQPGITQNLERLRRGIERAAGSVLGDETSTLRFAQNELRDLSRAVEREHAAGDEAPGSDAREESAAGDTPAARGNEEPASAELADSAPRDTQSDAESGRAGAPGADAPATAEARGGRSQAGRPDAAESGASRGDADLAQALQAMSGDARGGTSEGPLTGDGFTDWSERLRTVEALLEEPDARERVAGARETAERLRAEFRRHSNPPQWNVVESGIVAPLAEVRTWLRQELAQRENREALQPADRDPVPEQFAEAVQRYYEALGR